MKNKILKSAVLVSLGSLFVAGCDVYVRPPAAQVVVAGPTETVVADAPPAPQVEVETVSPGPDFVWIGGIWPGEVDDGSGNEVIGTARPAPERCGCRTVTNIAMAGMCSFTVGGGKQGIVCFALCVGVLQIALKIRLPETPLAGNGFGIDSAKEIMDTMQQTLHPSVRLGELKAQPKRAFKVFIACENHIAFFQARRVQQQVEAWCGNDVDISRVFWNFALLRSEELRAYAAREAAAAKMIFISLLGNHALPAHVKGWLESWPVRPQAGEAALVALVGTEPDPWADSQAEVAFLRTIAASRRLDFFCNRDGWERVEFSQPVIPRANEGPMSRGNITSHDIAWLRGGINE